MKTILNVFRFTYREGFQKKAFRISTIVVALILLIVCAVPNFFGNDANDAPVVTPDEKDASAICYVIDEDEKIPGMINALNLAFGDMDFQVGQADALEEYRKQIENDENLSALVIATGDPLPKLTFYSSNFMNELPTDAISTLIRKMYVSAILSEAGADADLTNIVTSDLEVASVTVGKMQMTGFVLGILITLLMFFAIYMYGNWVAMSVASEKTSRVMETLVVSAKPSHILLGKCLGMGMLGLTQMLVFLAIGVIGVKFLLPAGFTIGGMALSFETLTWQNALLLLLYFLLGYALYALLNSVCGATVSRSEDINAALTPIMLISLLAFYFSYFSALLPDSPARAIATYVPFTSSFVMPFRLLNDVVPAVDIVVSIAILLASIAIVAMLSVRLYTVSVLHYGQRLKLKDLWKSKL